MKILKINHTLIFLLFISLNSLSQEINDIEFSQKKAAKLRYVKPDSSAFFYNKSYKALIKKKDTVGAINTLIELSLLYAHNVDYGKSYDGYWKALLLADRSKDSVSLSEIYQQLGWLYSFYKRDNEALKYFNRSISIRKKQLKIDQSKQTYILSNYFSIINLYRLNKNFDMVKVYLDSCNQLQKNVSKNLKSPFILAEQGFVDANDGDFDSAFKKLEIAKNHFEQYEKPYLIIIHSLIGEVHELNNELDKSIENFNIAIELTNRFNRHLNYLPKLYEELSRVYLKKNDFEKAFINLEKSKQLNDAIFGSKSLNNQHLLKIKDKYRIEKDKQEAILKQQRIADLEKEDEIWWLKSIILIATIIFIIVFAYRSLKNLRTKHKNEKRLIEAKQQLYIQKQNDILELKNMELTEAALRLIEKDEFITSIKKKLSGQKDHIDVKVINRILKSIQGSLGKNWNEFEAQFTKINQSFYKNLQKHHPTLSQTDQKICALVKLNFRSKDMARLLGISVESVHTSRYRLRKKMRLQRNDNLEEFISKF